MKRLDYLIKVFMDKKDSNNLKIVTVANDIETYDKVIKNNENVKDFEKFLYDNSTENIGISKRYNSFINEKIKQDSDFWVIFCHQDFGFDDNPYLKISNLNKKNIYGAIGVKESFSLTRLVKSCLFKPFNFYPSVKINLSALKTHNMKNLILFTKEPFEGVIFRRRVCLGRIKQGKNNDDFEFNGRKISFPKSVDCLDCCCLIVHSSLINKYNMRFDENLDWHMYVEDFCFNAIFKNKIKVKAVQFNCFHLGAGTLNESFYKAVAYVKQKYKMKHISTTCIDD